MTPREKFKETFGREATAKETEVLKRVEETWYGEHMKWDSQLFVDYFCDYYFQIYRERCRLRLPK